jgi:hypothetical protein
MTVRRRRVKSKPDPQSQQPVATLAVVERHIRDNLALPDRVVEKLFKVAAHVKPAGMPYVLWNAAMLVAWDFQRMVRRNVRPWKRAWGWDADDRIALANEIVANIVANDEIVFLTRHWLEIALIELSYEMKMPFTVGHLAGRFAMSSVKSVQSKINTCRIVYSCVFLHLTSQTMP